MRDVDDRDWTAGERMTTEDIDPACLVLPQAAIEIQRLLIGREVHDDRFRESPSMNCP